MESMTLTHERPEAFLTEHLTQIGADPVIMADLSTRFRRDGYCRITPFIPKDILDLVRDEVLQLAEGHAVRRDILVAETGNTPRKMQNVSRDVVASRGSIIPSLYHNEALKAFLGALADDELVSCPWAEEEYLITVQHKPGDTHGWHWGDYPNTVIWVVEAPEIEAGGMLQCIPHTRWDKKNPRLYEHMVNNPIRTYDHRSGDVYFLKSDTTLHRTVPLNRAARRVILNTCWASKYDHRESVSHETMLQGFV